MQRTFIGDVLAWLRRHSAIAISGGIATYSALCILGLARWNADIAKTIAQEQSPAEIALGQALNLAAYALPTILAVAMLAPAAPAPLRRYLRVGIGTCWFISICALITLLAVLPTWLLIAFTPTALAAGFGIRHVARRRGAPPSRRQRGQRLRRSVAGFSGAYLLLMLISLTVTNPWLPREKVTFTGGETASAYVVSSTDSETVLITLGPHALVRVPTSVIAARELCDTTPAPFAPLSEPLLRFRQAPDLPTCPLKSTVPASAGGDVNERTS